MSGIVGTNAGRSSGKVGTVAVGADAITGDEIADDVLDSEHYVAASVDNEHLANDAVGTDEIADNAVTLDKMAGGTDGNIISFDASGNPVAIATGSDGQVLTSAGTGAPPAFEAIPGGGKVLQVVSVTKTDTFNSTATGLTDITGLTLAITCAATSSKVLVLWNINTGAPAGYNAGLQLSRAGTAIGGGGASSNRITGQFHHLTPTAATELNSGGTFLDAPSSTSALTYKFQTNYEGGSSGVWINRSTGHSDVATYVMSASTITLIEIGA